MADQTVKKYLSIGTTFDPVTCRWTVPLNVCMHTICDAKTIPGEGGGHVQHPDGHLQGAPEDQVHAQKT